MAGSVGPYRVGKPIARGGMGVVYEAWHEETGQPVALKRVSLPDAALLWSLRREIHALSRLRHPGIVRILDQGTHDGRPWYAMELASGEILSVRSGRARSDEGQRVTEPLPAHDGTTAAGRSHEVGRQRQPPQPGELAHVLTLMLRLCEPIRYMHGEGIVHRDLKPDNVIVRPDASVVIIDFGLAACFGSPDSRDVVSAHPGVAGTLGYIAPEQLCGDEVDARADLYALGCIIYELLAGRPPFTGADAMALIRRHLSEEPVPPSHYAPHVPEELDLLVLRLLAPEARELYERSLDLARETGDQSGETVALGNLAALELAEGRGVAARELCERALGISRAIGDRRNEGYMGYKLGAIECSLGGYAAAGELLEQSIRTARTVGDRRLEGMAILQLARQRQALGRSGEALSLEDEALALAQEAGDVKLEIWALEQTADHHAALGNHGLASSLSARARRFEDEAPPRP